MSDLLSLFDQLCDCDPSEQQRQLAELDAAQPALALRLRAMLKADAGAAVLAQDMDLQPSLSVSSWHLADRAGERFGPYCLLHSLGSGGMGTVWLAERTLGASVQAVAIKFMHRGREARLLKQFNSERNALARLEHPNIARLIDAGVTPDGEPFIATEYVDGAPLLDYVRTQKLDLSERLKLIESLCEAVDYAHRRLLIHRDIKPSNVMVDQTGRARLLDFGIAKAIDADATDETLNNPLSPAYAAPEQALGEPVSTATDTFALGLLLFELLTGRLPMQRRGLRFQDLARRVATETIEAPSAADLAGLAELDPQLAAREWPRRLKGDLDHIVLKALKREPERRYPSALALAEDLRRFRSGRPVMARPDSVGYRLRKLITRHPFASVAVSLSALAIFGLSGVALVQSLKAERSAERAIRAQNFVLSTFASADPQQMRGEKLTAKEILASGRSRVALEFRDDPQQQAQLTLELAQIYANLQEHATLVEMARAALEAIKRMPQPDRDLSAKAHALLSNGLFWRSEYAAAQKHAERAVVLYRAAGPKFRTQLGSALMALGATQLANSQVPAGLEAQSEALALLALDPGRDSAEFALACVQNAQLLEDYGRFTEARARYVEGISVLRLVRGEMHPDTAAARVSLAGILDRLGDTAGATREFASGIAALRRLYDNKGGTLSAALMSQGIFLQAAGQHAQAEASYREALTLVDAKSPTFAHLNRYLGQVLLLERRATEAHEVLVVAVDAYASAGGVAVAQMWRANADVGVALAQLGRESEALVLQMEAVKKLGALINPDAYELIRPLRSLAQTQIVLEQFAAAETSLAHSLRIATAQIGATHITTCGIHQSIAALALKAGRPEAANAVQEPLRACESALEKTHSQAPVLADIKLTLATLERPR